MPLPAGASRTPAGITELGDGHRHAGGTRSPIAHSPRDGAPRPEHRGGFVERQHPRDPSNTWRGDHGVFIWVPSPLEMTLPCPGLQREPEPRARRMLRAPVPMGATATPLAGVGEPCPGSHFPPETMKTSAHPQLRSQIMTCALMPVIQEETGTRLELWHINYEAPHLPGPGLCPRHAGQRRSSASTCSCFCQRNISSMERALRSLCPAPGH